ncbi:hypothetical protein BJ944DRAFT_245837 [Cunninghamella echinulata]|nr:hypothetical protein BJ944DRAFT_245837 [Cunninghamella echinulata]
MSEHVSMPKVETYPPSQISMSTEVNTTEQLKLQDENATNSMLRLRGGGCVKGCLETICCCCALEAIWYNDLKNKIEPNFVSQFICL